ncbi:MAG: hypothetical protein LUC33_05550 [Prevotellaceae bacterium]|nr:hypothetical protein [Prevotellaceae bacterium]
MSYFTRDPELFDARRRYSFSEAAEVWGCSESTLRRIVAERPWMLANNKVLRKWQLTGAALNKVYYGREELDAKGKPVRRKATLQAMF